MLTRWVCVGGVRERPITNSGCAPVLVYSKQSSRCLVHVMPTLNVSEYFKVCALKAGGGVLACPWVGRC